MIKVLYFASFREALNRAEETIELTDNIKKIQDLVEQLCQRGFIWHSTLTGANALIAINQEFTDVDAPVKSGDEVAFFPPVTGG